MRAVRRPRHGRGRAVVQVDGRLEHAAVDVPHDGHALLADRDDEVAARVERERAHGVVRRAGSGERIIVTVDGEPVAQLGPLEPTGEPTIEDLAAAGLVRLPGRADRPAPPDPFGVPVDVRPAAVIAELRGEPS